MTRALLIVALLASAAQADVWQRAIDGKQTLDTYETEMQAGDELAMRANAKGQQRTAVTRLVDGAIDRYRQAAKARPTEGEPYYRIASLLESFFTDCQPPYYRGRPIAIPPPTCPVPRQSLDTTRAEATLEAWSEFEKRAPLDPRTNDSLFSRAILRTRLVSSSKDPKPLLEGALANYRALLDRNDGLSIADPYHIWGNLAETYMMLGRMDEAIEAYRISLRLGAGSSVAFGLAVALDRDGSPAEAIELIRSQPEQSFRQFDEWLATGSLFFVPSGEEYYYKALMAEARGLYRDAIENWKKYIDSGAHAEHVPRARQRLDALQATGKLQPFTRATPRH